MSLSHPRFYVGTQTDRSRQEDGVESEVSEVLLVRASKDTVPSQKHVPSRGTRTARRT